MTFCRCFSDSLLLATGAGDQTQLLHNASPRNAPMLRELLRQFEASHVPTLDLIREVKQLSLLVWGELLRFSLRLKVVVTLPGRLRQPLLNLPEQFALSGGER
jgi:hypothetical protein